MGVEKESVNIDGMNGLERALKRLGDVVGAMVLLIVLSPVFLSMPSVPQCPVRSAGSRRRRIPGS